MTISRKYGLVVFVFVLTVFILNPILAAAQKRNSGYKLTLAEAVQMAKSQNKWVQAAGIQESEALEERKDAFTAALPTINLGGSYQRFSNLTLFSEGLSHATTISTPPTPNAANLGVDASFNIYSGGRLRALQKEQSSHVNEAKLNSRDRSGNVALQTAVQYLDMVKLNDLKRFILDQLKRAQTRLSNINALYKNQKVTRSDVLRAEVTLANVQLSLQQNENDISIANQRLDILINMPDSVQISPADSAGMPKPGVGTLLPFVEAASVSSYSVQKATENIETQKAKLKAVQSSNMPSLNFYSAYGINYPNFLVFPPVNQAYALGFVGLRAQYSISSLYHNKSKVAAGKLKVKELEVEQEAYKDNVNTEVKSYYVKYAEALNRISVNEHSVEQAQVNYRIVNTKYLNQLALLTDLLDADNLYQESRFNLVKAQTDALAIYYHILYTSGSL
ncbi:TolC family protein [Mucilaginibacter rubeus]|uniref:TolC family protein n=1 Tax=Mucilaginibacter rubeus TaxID=2027860 RepID=A0AAE6MGK2_9SPHI|nr:MULTISPECIES: TolC family protein [Mucilaginibacter]QEM02601.1 TolC family protein [Mucilaginibacter rubeus]QEM15222.1 TolC family protein [Mucilaginibacter gossypii]QTE42054.1 TolC family protein [Mucilaginibacter rubeus]QTE48655.1 TolC family protein [Mucilaginibacter rubeus]QTE60041.1 TolC family protein [Mucilaginibacter rubeus]